MPGDGPAPDGIGPDSERRSRRYLAAVLLGAAGGIDFLTGLAIVPLEPYVDIASAEMFHLDITSWGWVRLVGGVATAVAGLAVLVDRRATTVAAIVTATVGIGLGILLLPYRPLAVWMTAALAAVALWLLAGQLRAASRTPASRV
ncbi:DUF7144 family membrane protein [Micromonospora sp. DT46]|uniref:DUF7144 family membrane protein n=1 Tax=unclassified Micromonospora TaxID=2617518 RepID=UPI00124B1F95|nr:MULTISPECIES: hypothetical protein [unclassified Micromonospora]KAB1139842.1 hypothetical protein F6X68_23145 [Micromonospora sp. AMSO12t]WSG00364.1 hypothetical protein OG989_22095 [Micromonospora sp. NBC_01740]